MSWRDFATAPKDREIFASVLRRQSRFKTCGQRFRFVEGEWQQFVAGYWYRPFFTPTHWDEISESGARPAPMFAE